MSENLIYADLNLTESTSRRLQKVTDAQGSVYAEVKVQSLDTNAAASYTSCGKICCSRTRVAVLVAVTILLLVSAVCLIVMWTPGVAETGRDPQWSGENQNQDHTGCPQDWKKYGKKCYFFSQTRGGKHWNASRQECIDMKSDLVIIDNNETLQYLISQSSGHYYLLGLTYSETEHKWKWINNVEHSPDIFPIEEFSNYFCAVIRHKVETASCEGSSTTRTMCEKASSTSERQKES
ncbi:natural killer cells antigen CD94-like [Athene cunicularia]|uniref:natural killer cells antigen CD94-like n=1 Tax=Athene cunicularia TaxID=194338 RepID=UPI000EF66C92|nr:natural killer cells antigen CD94-like [Athene cunicularia]